MSDVIRKVSTIFTIDDNEHNKKLKDINTQYKLTQSEIKLAGEKLDAFGKSTDNLRSKQDALVKQTSTLNDKINLYKDSIEKSSLRAEENNKKLQELKSTKEILEARYKSTIKAMGDESEEAIKLKEQLGDVTQKYNEQKAVVDKNITTVNNHKIKLTEAETQLTKVQGALKDTSSELEKQNNKWITASNTLKTAGEKISSVGSNMADLGGKLTKTATIPILAFGAAAVKADVSFESAFAGVKKTVNATDEEFAQLEEGIRNMSKSIPSSAEDISHVAESAGQLGIQKDNILSFTKTIIDLGNATNLVGEEGASELAKFANITQMSQGDFQKLGSSIVYLGNNMATTEADIMSMAMRLAGAGHQVGLTQAQIVGMSAGLSSLGLDAEAAGSAMSKVMLDIQMQVQTNGKELKEFAKVAGMSTQEFANKFKTDAAGALNDFIIGLGKLDNKAVILDELGLSEIRVRDALLRASGAGDIFTKSMKMSSDAWEENNALTKEANQRYATTESKMIVTKNQVMDLAREVGRDLLPIAKDGLEVIKQLIEKFNQLTPQQKEQILKFAALAAATGPVIGGTGKIVEGFGSIIKVGSSLTGAIGKITSATKGVGTAAEVAAGIGEVGGMAGFATSLGGVVVAAAPYLVAGAAIAGAGYAIYKGLNQEVIPSMDLFADKLDYTAATTQNSYDMMGAATEVTVTKISEATKKGVGAYVDLDNQAKEKIEDLYINSTIISEQIKNELISKTNEMATQVVQGYEKQKNDSIKELQDMFMDSQSILTDGQTQMLTSINSYYESRKLATQQQEQSINNIISTASQEKRTLTQEEVTQITNLQNQMRQNAVKALSQNEVEAQVILQRMKDYDGTITAQQASEHIKKLNESRDNAIKAANDEYDQRIAIITRLRDESGVITKDQADQMIEEAKRQKDGIVQNAEDTRTEAVDKIFGMNKDLANNVDSTTGEILTWWNKLTGAWDRWTPSVKTFSYTVHGNLTGTDKMSGPSMYALGTNNFEGGLTTINERGYELVDLPRGTKITNHLQSENIVKDTAMQTAKAVVDSLGAILNTDKQVILMMNDRAVGEAIIPIVSNKLAVNKIRRRY
ncbi:phage tail tape measure protein [Clostridium sp. YIM B02551]|uniref:phage tail tape measure protein n=1 Tax=Clostridium sp. YIM B02551 TaxID=2910679 RepID=UPI001EEB0015|nr:phage tail tape measure protein [Clostridium sp. YIM B02551]